MYCRNKRGFTLIEVLVSLTIMALITGVAFAGLSIGIDSWRRGSQKIEELDRRFSVERLVQRQLAQADPELFQGGASDLTFRSAYSLANGPGDPVVVKYSFDSGKLVYVETLATEYSPELAPTGIGQTLGVFSRIGFKYLSTDALEKPIWLDEWKEKTLPSVVQAQIGDDLLTIPMVNRR